MKTKKKSLMTIFLVLLAMISWGQVETTVCDDSKDDVKVTCDANGLITGTIKHSESDVYIQQSRWNKWITWDTLKTKGKGEVEVNFQLSKHSGMNLFRIMATDYPECKSKGMVEIIIDDPIRMVDFNPKSPTTEIVFSEKTAYEIFNPLGEIVAKGSGNKVNIEELDDGIYYLCYDNIMVNFTKKK